MMAAAISLRRMGLLGLVGGGLMLAAPGCSYRHWAGDLKPLDKAMQGESRTVADDGTVTYTQGRLEIGVRPMTSDELNRQFASNSNAGAHSTNPYTFGNSVSFRQGGTPQRFLVFRLRVENYEFPKVYVDPQIPYIVTENGRRYYALGFEQLNIYHRRYSRGGEGGDSSGIPGNEFHEWKTRQNLLNRTLFPDETIFSAQEKEGYLVFRPLDPDVSGLTLHIPDVVVRFDYKGDPTERVDVSARFRRDVGRIYSDGEIVMAK